MKRRKHCWYQQSDFGWGNARNKHGILVREVIRRWIATARSLVDDDNLTENERAFTQALREQFEKGVLPTPEQEQQLELLAKRHCSISMLPG